MDKFKIILYFIIISGLFSQCSKKLERVPVSVSQSVFISPDADTITVIKGIQEVLHSKTNLTLELDLRSDAYNLPSLQLKQWEILKSIDNAKLLEQNPCNIILTSLHSDSLFREDIVLNPNAWFLRLEDICDSLITILGAENISKLCLGSSLLRLESESKCWKSLTDSLRKKYNIPLLYSTSPEQAAFFPSWKCFDEIGIIYELPSGELMKPYARETNTSLSALSEKVNKPIWISSADLNGNEKKLKLMNHLRFWNESVLLSGINFSTIYSNPIVADSTSPFGIKNETELLNYINEINNESK